jgi:hypothetical protein
VHDFLFQYYRYSPAKLEEWHPGVGVALRDSPVARERFSPPRYRREGDALSLDPDRLSEKEAARMAWTRSLLERTQRRTPSFSCFGLHEWAMVYRADEVRHAGTVPVRLPQAEIDRLVESRPLVCTHFDAYRFFTPEAKPRNRFQPALLQREQMEQPGCLHANMDLYKWAYKSMPWIGSSLLLETFELAVRLRTLDMRASPYDLRSLGYTPVPVETAAGRAEYQAEQRRFAEEAAELRGRLIEALDTVLAWASVPGA